MMNQQQPSTHGKFGNFSLTWDTQTAAAAIVLGALVLLVAVRKGFGPLVLSVGS